MERRTFLRRALGLAIVAPVLAQPQRVYSFLWNNPLAKPDWQRQVDAALQGLVPIKPSIIEPGTIDFPWKMEEFEYNSETRMMTAKMRYLKPIEIITVDMIITSDVARFA